MILWYRLGEKADYEPVEDIASAADVLKEIGVTAKSHVRRTMCGIKADGFEDYNYISLFWGEEGQPQMVEQLKDEEFEELISFL